MKMIDVLNMMAEGTLKEGTKLKIGYKIYNYIKDYTESENCSFVNEEDDRIEFLEDNEFITTDFLNKEVELIQPMKKKYLIKVNVQWFDKDFAYLNYDKQRNCVNIYNKIIIYNKIENMTYKTQFTKQELKSIKPIREFLEDIEGKYELIEVEE